MLTGDNLVQKQHLSEAKSLKGKTGQELHLMKKKKQEKILKKFKSNVSQQIERGVGIIMGIISLNN